MRYALILFCLSGCATLRPARHALKTNAVPTDRCSSLATKAEVQHVLAIVFGGVGPVAASITPALSDHPLAQDLTLGAASALGLVGAVLAFTGGVASANYSKECP
jgi:hypothetical protein